MLCGCKGEVVYDEKLIYDDDYGETKECFKDMIIYCQKCGRAWLYDGRTAKDIDTNEVDFKIDYSSQPKGVKPLPLKIIMIKI